MCLVSWQMGWQLNDLECLQRLAVERLLARVTGRLGLSPVSFTWQASKCSERGQAPMHMCFTASACSTFALSHGPKQITWPRFKEWRNRLHLWMREVAESHCKEARTGWEESVTILYATGAVRNYDVPGTMLVTHLFHLPPRCSELPWHHGKQKDLRLSYKMCVGNDWGVGEEACSREVLWLGHKDVLHLLI